VAAATNKFPFLCTENSFCMKKIILFFLLLPVFLSAQQNPLFVEGVSPSLYIRHKVAPKENYYSVGRIYNVSPKDIAPFNKLQLETGLTLGQTIKIPLSGSNFSQSGNAEADETFVPLYYKIKGKEGLYRVAKNHNELPLETLKQWNNIKGDAVKTGTQLIVGYLKVKTELSSLAKSGAVSTTIAAAPVKPAETKPAEPEIVTKPVVEKETEKTNTKQTRKEKRAAEKIAAANEKINATPAKETPVTETPKTVSAKSSSGVSFKSLYDQQKKNAETIETTGNAGVFKSTSGWADGKYYCLHSSSSAGTIIKITNTANGKFVFAKVLDNIPDIKQNEGLIIVISNAAADVLGATEANFNCTVNYAK
jgi:LysM repeat protein/rare lipoprotein A (peptidoglycan hydrolase)